MAPPRHREAISNEELERRRRALEEAKAKELAERSKEPKEKPPLVMKERRRIKKKPTA
jgi:hypothetical protein